MDTAVALIVLLGLAVALLLARRSAKTRRKKLLEERERRRQTKYKPRPMSHRGEMRAYDDPSTLAGEITTRGSTPTTTQNPSAGVATNPGATGKRSRADGKSGV